MAVEINTEKLQVELNPNTVSGQVGIPVRVQGLIGPEGPQGVSGVWLGEEPPTNDDYDVWIDPEGYATDIVSTVNGKKGEVNLTAKDVGALPANTVIPTGYDAMSNLEVMQIWHGNI